MGQLIPQPRSVRVDGSGAPYAGALRNVYLPATTTRVSLFPTQADADAGTNPLTNPLTADGNGVFPPVYVADSLQAVRVVDTTSADVQLSDDDNVPVAGLSPQSAGRLLYPLTAAEQAAGVTPSDYRYPPGDVRRYGAVGDGATNSETAFTSAMAQCSSGGAAVFVPEGAFMVNGLTVPDNVRIAGAGLRSIVRKRANGDMFTLGRFAVLENMWIDGNAPAFTGRGVVIPFTAEFEGGQQIRWCRIWDTESFNVEYVSGAAGAGFGSEIAFCDLRVRSNTVPCIKWGADPVNKHGNRSIIGCTAGSGPLVDVSTADNGFIIGNTIGDNGSSAGILFGATCAKIMVANNRIATTTTIQFQGQSNVFVGNVCGGAFTATANCIGSRVSGNVFVGAVTDNSGGQQNEIDIPPTAFTPTWTGSVSNPVLGNGSIAGTWSRRGRHVTWTLDLNIGSTTTFGSGEWRFSLPPGGVSASQPAWGTCLMWDASGTPVIGTIWIAADATFAVVYMHGVVGTLGPTAPFTWANGDFLRATITYVAG